MNAYTFHIITMQVNTMNNVERSESERNLNINDEVSVSSLGR